MSGSSPNTSVYSDQFLDDLRQSTERARQEIGHRFGELGFQADRIAGYSEIANSLRREADRINSRIISTADPDGSLKLARFRLLETATSKYGVSSRVSMNYKHLPEWKAVWKKADAFIGERSEIVPYKDRPSWIERNEPRK